VFPFRVSVDEISAYGLTYCHYLRIFQVRKVRPYGALKNHRALPPVLELITGNNRSRFIREYILFLFAKGFLMKALFTKQFFFVTALILIAIASRFTGVPNVNPIVAIALFGGAYFADKRLAFIVPIFFFFFSEL